MIITLLSYLVPFKFMFGIFETTFYRIIVIALLFVYLSKSMIMHRFVFKLSLEDVFLLACLMMLFSSILWSQYWYETARYSLDLVFLIILYFLAKGSYDTLDYMYRGVSKLYYFLGIGLNLLAFVILAEFGSLRLYEHTSFLGSNELAQWSIICICFLIMRAFNEKSIIKKTLTYILCGSLSGIVLMSGSRSGLFGLTALFLIVILYLLYRHVYSLYRIGLAAIIVVCSVWMLFLGFRAQFNESIDRIVTRLPLQQGELIFDEEIVGEGRYYMYKYGLEMLEENWLKGIGFGTFKTHMEERYGVKRKIPHNVLLRVWLGGGVLSLLFFIGFVVITIKRGLSLVAYFGKLKNTEHSLFVFSLVLGFFVLILLGLGNPILNNPLLYINVAFIVKMAEISKKTRVMKLIF